MQKFFIGSSQVLVRRLLAVNRRPHLAEATVPAAMPIVLAAVYHQAPLHRDQQLIQTRATAIVCRAVAAAQPHRLQQTFQTEQQCESSVSSNL